MGGEPCGHCFSSAGQPRGRCLKCPVEQNPLSRRWGGESAVGEVDGEWECQVGFTYNSNQSNSEKLTLIWNFLCRPLL